MAHTDTEVRDVLVVDNGPVSRAALILAEQTTLADHVVVTADGYTTTIAMIDGALPFAVWGSGTQALWRLLSAIAYTSEQVSLYEVFSRLDSRNSAAAAAAVAELARAAA